MTFQTITNPVLTNRFSSYPIVINSVMEKEKQVELSFWGDF